MLLNPLTTPLRALGVLLLITLYSPSALAIEENTMVTVTRIQIEIDRPVTTVWPYVLDFNKWSDNHVIEQLAGTPATIGNIVRRRITSGDFKQVRTEEILFIEENQRIVLRVHPEPNPTNMMVTVNMELIPRGENGSIFQLDVYMRDEAPGEIPLPREQLVDQQTEIGSAMAVALIPEFSRLKYAVEADTPAR